MLQSQPAARKPSKPKATKPKAPRPVAEVLASPPGSLALIELARTGIELQVVEAFRKEYGLTLAQLARILHVSERTLQRKQPHDRLDPSATERFVALSRLFRWGIEVYQGKELFLEYLNSPIIALGLRRPMEFLDTFEGIQHIYDEVGRFAYGVY